MTGASTATSLGEAKRAWKLQEFVAHGASVNCVSLGHKSGRVLVTGGDDKKVNLWAVGKPNCIMSLVGHSTPIECVRFGQTEELVVAGSASGTLKIWDLEAAKLVRTLTGHKAGLTCADFHPYGDYLASGSADKNLKLWDVRRKGCVFTYKGHANRVNGLKFSPDGQWIGSAGEDAAVRIWDLRAGKLMAEFKGHEGPVLDVEFHPHEFLLASSSQDRTVHFWDLEGFCEISCSDRGTGPIRTIVFHPEGNALFSGSNDWLKIHQWEPVPVIADCVPMGWGKIRDVAVAATQLIGVAYNGSNVSIHVVDLNQTRPFNGVPLVPAAHSTRRSFVKEKVGPDGQRAAPQVKVSDDQTSSDRSGTDPEDSDGSVHPTAAIRDSKRFENIFRPRQRQLNRTPPPNGTVANNNNGNDAPYYEPFQAPLSSSESENSLARPTELRLKGTAQTSKGPSPTAKRRQSQPTAPAGYGGSPVRVRKGSNPSTPTGPYHKSIQNQVAYPTSASSSTSVYLSSPTRADVEPPCHIRSTSVTRLTSGTSSPQSSSSKQQQQQQPNNQQKSLDKPVTVRQSQRTSVHIPSPNEIPVDKESPSFGGGGGGSCQLVPSRQFFPVVYSNSGDSSISSSGGGPARKTVANLPLPNDLTLEQLRVRAGNAAFTNARNRPLDVPSSPEKKLEVVPMNADKPTGLPVDDFLPKKFSGLGFDYNTAEVTSKFSSYKDYSSGSEMSESEVTSSVLKGHHAMMAVLTTRGRNMEIIQKLWQSKDAKAAVDQAVSLNDQSIMVDLLSVITFRPSIWNLDLCESLLPVIENLLQSKYEMYISVGCGAIKLILKNFASVIKSNIDGPMQTVGVDISREERHRKCMQCYKDLVKIRSLILKRQSVQGKLGHTFRELAILMQYLD